MLTAATVDGHVAAMYDRSAEASISPRKSTLGRQFQFTEIDYSRSAITVETVAISCPTAGERQVSKYSG